ncbi:alpha-hydroxy acid oxidase [Streptomyces hoynatensis]|uniref:Alpha-hydroxy-acid oxidizing protein n=1 Tax=Streptomyces hoynatensis TaxID=1141874 RepID=A0A3A9ZIE0_9ACTN|nr:alpha-hydroxy acid oxidase [Streptomyces hoynatensis]RKN47016.1 alpha-hydroxy-acid oxidizing protein [Streptomyces hoynatensis]
MNGTGNPVVSDQLRRARETLPAEVFAYIESGSFGEESAREAAGAWARYRFLPHALRDVRRVDTSVRLLGSTFASPIAAAPSAFHALAHPRGEAASRAAFGKDGSLFIASVRSSLPLARIAEAGAGDWWYQTFAMRDPGPALDLVAQARDLGATAVVLTGDTPVVGPKYRVAGRRIRVPDEQFFSNVPAGPGADQRDFPPLEESPAATVAYIRRLRAACGLPVLVKGVLRPDDALRVLDAGAAGVIVSNHGGRQCGRAVSTAEALPAVAAAVGGRAPVLVDGGIRSGVDAAAALALGASMVLIGRPVLWALAAGGEDAVLGLLAALRGELEQMLALLGVPDLAALTPGLLRSQGRAEDLLPAEAGRWAAPPMPT